VTGENSSDGDFVTVVYKERKLNYKKIMLVKPEGKRKKD
jgi:hypothetical protein